MGAIDNLNTRGAVCLAGLVRAGCFLPFLATGFAAAQEPVEIEIPVRTAGYGIAFYEETARLFEAQQPGVRVNIYGDPRIDDKVRVRVIDGSYPDATVPARMPSSGVMPVLIIR
jgi:ABC-type glycerol-3-phosphate transport system substrate-binding protein